MSDLIRIVSWERFCTKDQISDLEKYMECPLQQCPGLLDLRCLNLRSVGIAVRDLPDNCLETVAGRMKQALVRTRGDWGDGGADNGGEMAHRMSVLTRMACLVARHPNNLANLEEHSVPATIQRLVDTALTQLCKEMDNEWLNLLEYSLYFLEIIYDPTFSWRRRKKLFYNESAVLETSKQTLARPLSITMETTTWLCSQLNTYFRDRDTRSRLMHLLCAITSGRKENAQFMISPATVDAFQFESDVDVDTIVSYSCLISCLSEIPISERQEDLQLVVKKLFGFITNKAEIRISELRCIYQLLFVSYELNTELIKQGLLTVIKICLTAVNQDQEQCRFCFMLLSRLTSGEFQAQDQFIFSRGYDELLGYLTSTPLQPAFLLDLIFTWAVSEPFDASKMANSRYEIRDGNVIGLLIRWGTHLAFLYEKESENTNIEEENKNQSPQPVVNWKAIFKLVMELCHKSRSSISRCCDSGVIEVITECIKQACFHIDTNTPSVIDHDDKGLCRRLSTIQRKCDELLKGLFHLMEIFCSYSFPGRDLKSVMQLFKDKYTRTRCKKLIKILFNIIPTKENYEDINCWFELSQPGDCISIAPSNDHSESTMKHYFNNSQIDRRLSPQKLLDSIAWKLNANGFSFHCWLNINSLSVLEKVDAGHERSSIFRVLTENHNGFEAFLNMDGQLIVATCHNGEFHYTQVTSNTTRRNSLIMEDAFLKPGKWHMIDLVFQNSKNFFSKPFVHVYINGALINSVELKYPTITENISVFHIGGCPKNLKIENRFMNELKSRKKTGFMTNNSIKKAILSEEHQSWGRIGTLKCRIVSVACLNDAMTDISIASLYNKGPMDTLAILGDESLSGNILINYHSRAFDSNSRYCFNLHSYIQSSRSNRYHAGSLTGQWLTCQKFQDVINEVGGFAALIPIIEQLEFMDFKNSTAEQDEGYQFDELDFYKDDVQNSPSHLDEELFIVVPDQSKENKWNESILANIVILFKKLLLFDTNQQQMERVKFIPIIGAMLQQIEILLLDMNVVLAFHALANSCSSNISSQIYQFVLLDWRIWSRCNFDIREQHCAFISNLVKLDRNMFRKQYGIILFLDAIRFYHSPSLVEGVDIHKKLRENIFTMIFYLIHKHATIQDYQKILKFVHECNDNDMIQESLGLLTKLYNSSDKTHQDSLLLYENHLMESLFVLLIRDLSVQTKEDTIKFLHLIITSCRTPDRFKNHLLLNEISFASIFTFKEFCQSPLSPESIENLLDIIKKAAAKDLYGVIQFLSLLTLSPINQRVSAVKMLKSFFDKSPDAILAISKQPGWQDILIHLLALKKREEMEVVVSTTEEPSLQTKDINANEKGFRRSSTWVFDETSNENGMTFSTKFENVLEEDEDEYSMMDQLTDNQETFDDNLENKSIDTLFLRQHSSNNGEANTDDASLTMSINYFPRQFTCEGFYNSDDITHQVKSTNGLIEAGEKRNIQSDLDILQKELVDLVLNCLQKVMWTVLSSSTDQQSWMVVHQVLESLRSVNERYVLLCDLFTLKQKIFVGLLNSLIDLYKRNEQFTAQLMVHAKEMVFVIVDSTCHNVGQEQFQYDSQLLDQTTLMFQECLRVWDEDNLFPDMTALGFFYLLTLSCDANLNIVSSVCARLHQIITGISKNITYEEIAFIIVHLDRVLCKIINDDNYYFVAPILKTLLEIHGEVLQIEDYLSSISIRSAEFIDNFKKYCNNVEWKSFINNRLSSASEIYETNYLNEMSTVQSLWRAQANEQMSLDRKKRWAVSSDHRKRFEKEIISMTLKWGKEERRRKEGALKDMQMQNEATLRYWRVIKQYLTSSKGCWFDKSASSKVYWKQSCRENALRMRPRFDPNYQFNQHLDASKERDNPSHSKKEIEPDPLMCLSALEGKIDFTALGDDQLGDDEWMTIQSTGLTETTSGSSPNLLTGLKKNAIFECRCKLIKFTEVVEGKFELTTSHFIFHGINISVEAIDSNTSQMVHSVNQIREVHLRRYNLRRSAIEIFLTDQTNYFFDFSTKIRNKVYSKILSLRPPNLIYSKQRSPADLLKSSNLTQKWVNREISNFEYLLQLNTIAGRTYNDMSQYPVFPWIIADYTSPTLDLNNPKTFRDLSKPIGVVNPKNEAEIREKYEGFEDPSGVIEKFHYGTHYSSAAGVMHYMVRVEPFTTMHIQLQSGKFDVADRQFHSIPMAWAFIMESPNDNKELIPEFFYQPEFLRNQNNFEFGLLQQTKTPIDDVELPAWANSPEDFIYQHQQALECEYVSQNLHHWIDLIFGYKQKGPEAVKALNVFYYVTYEGVVDLDLINDPFERESIESMINNFGQTPCQLLKHPHPKRLTEAEERSQMIKIEKYLPVISNVGALQHTSKSICSASEPIVFVRVPVAQPRSFIGTDKSLSMITIHSSNIFAKHNWMPNYKNTGLTYHIDVDSVFDSLNSRRKNFLGNLSSLVESSNKIYEVTPDCKFIITGGNIENRLTIMSLVKKEIINVPTPHHLPVSCVSLDIDSISPMTITSGSLGSVGAPSMVGIRLYGTTGSLDSTCVVWDWTDLPTSTVIQTLCGHSGPVTSVSLCMYLDIVLTGSEDGTVNLHTVMRGQFLHSITPGGLSSSTLSINFVEISRIGHVYIQWQHGISPSKDQFKSLPASCSASHPKQYISVYSLHANHISTCELGHSKVNVMKVVSKSPGILNNCALVGNTKGELYILDGYYLSDQSTLNFNHPILDAQLLSPNGQHLAVALSNGCLIISSVSLSKLEK